ncbi:MAG TPA: putative lipopolysaccharide heptosyltransferase III [Chlamydiales bacterium]|nr:putative lipopolysaccharide heptosyltransferase III [Chlamydiales bacterium]
MTYGNYPKREDISKILVIKLRHMGDVILTTPLFASLKEFLPHAQVDAYIYEECKELLEDNPNIDHLHTYDRKWKKKPFWKRIFLEIKNLKKLREKKYDLVINLTEGDRGKIVTKVVSPKYSMAYERDRSYNKAFTHIMKTTTMPRHTVEKNLDAVRKLGYNPEGKVKQLQIYLSEEFEQQILHKFSLTFKGYIVLHPMSRWRFKSYPLPSMLKVVEKLTCKGEMIVITGGEAPFEKEFAKQIEEKFPKVINLCGKTSLKEAAVIVKNAKALITVDTMTLHMASAFATPTVAIFGPTSSITWGPYGFKNFEIVSSNMACQPCSFDGCGGSKIADCLYRITPEDILFSYDKVLEKIT